MLFFILFLSFIVSGPVPSIFSSEISLASGVRAKISLANEPCGGVLFSKDKLCLLTKLLSSPWNEASGIWLKTEAVEGVTCKADDPVKDNCGVLPGGDVEEDAGHVADVTAGGWATSGIGDFVATFFPMLSSSTFLGVNGTIPLQYNFFPSFLSHGLLQSRLGKFHSSMI